MLHRSGYHVAIDFLTRAGFRIAVDDVGAGSNSLSVLADLLQGFLYGRPLIAEAGFA